jgi:hypothetical protein
MQTDSYRARLAIGRKDPYACDVEAALATRLASVLQQSMSSGSPDCTRNHKTHAVVRCRHEHRREWTCRSLLCRATACQAADLRLSIAAHSNCLIQATHPAVRWPSLGIPLYACCYSPRAN